MEEKISEQSGLQEKIVERILQKNFDPIKDIPNGVYLTGFFSNTPTQEIIDKIYLIKIFTSRGDFVIMYKNFLD